MEKLDSVRRVMERGKVQNLFGRFGGAFVDVTGIISVWKGLRLVFLLLTGEIKSLTIQTNKKTGYAENDTTT